MRGDSDVVEAVRLLARCHQGLIWARQRHLNQVRTALREFYPGALAAFGTDLAHPDAVAVLSAAPTPSAARKLTDARIARLLRAAGRQRRINRRAAEIGQRCGPRRWQRPEWWPTPTAPLSPPASA